MIELPIPLILGLLMLIFREAFARIVVQAQNDAWHKKLGDDDVRAAKAAYSVGALILIASSAMWGEQNKNIEYFIMAMVAAFGAWWLSTYRPISNIQKRIVVKSSKLPPVGNSPIYFVLIVLAVATFATIVIGSIFWGWN